MIDVFSYNSMIAELHFKEEFSLRFLFRVITPLAAVFLVIFLSGLFVIPANAATGWHIKDDVTGGDCSLIGSWDAGSKTCTLSQDLSQGIIIDSNNIVLDGGGHMVTGTATLIETGFYTDSGVYLIGRNGVTIKNINVQKFGLGILLDSSNNNTLIGNTTNFNNYAGIELSSSHNNTLTDNTASNNNTKINNRGIYLSSSNNNILTGNTTNSNNSTGIALDSSNSNTLIDNTASNNGFGIELSHSSNNSMMNNTVHENLAYDIKVVALLENDCNNSITNTIGSGGRPIKYFSSAVNLSNEILSELILCNADGSNISGVTIDGSSTRQNNGLLLVKTDSSTITNINSSNNLSGIYLLFSNNNTLTGDTTNSNNSTGIALDESSNNNALADNTVSNNGNAIFVTLSSNNTFTNNTANSNGMGIFVDTSGTDNRFIGNKIFCNSNGNNGITVSGGNGPGHRVIIVGNDVSNCGFGLVFDFGAWTVGNEIKKNIFHSNEIGILLANHALTQDSVISENIIDSNRHIGIAHVGAFSSCEYETNNTIKNNTISNTRPSRSGDHPDEWGVGYYGACGINKIYNNNFINNVIQTRTYLQEVFNLTTPTGGNYWSDCDELKIRCPDSNDDGFWDSPYIFTGGQDNLPWTKKDGWLASQNQLPTLSTLLQWDGSTSLSEGWILPSPRAISFSANISDSDDDQVKLQVELRRFEESFTGIDDGGILTSDLAVSGSTARITRTGLSDGKYHWHARAIDSNGNKSEWQEFGSVGNVDFDILTNQPPVASFTFTPQNPKVGEQIAFNAASSTDPDGAIVLYGWDWESDGLTDIYSSTPFMQYDGFLEGIFTTTLRVTDNRGGVGSISTVVSVAPTNQSTAYASILDAFCSAFGGWWCGTTVNQDEKNINILDEWLRDENGDGVADANTAPFYWLKGTKCGGAGTSLKQQECLISALNAKFTSESGLTYKAYIFSVITEQKMIEKAFLKQTPDPYRLYMTLVLDWLPFTSAADIFYNDITSDGIKTFLIEAAPFLSFSAADVFTYGSSFLSAVTTAKKLDMAFDKMDDWKYQSALSAYLLNRGLGGDEKYAWNSVEPVLITQMSNKMLEETRMNFGEWWQKYYVGIQNKYSDPVFSAFGLNNHFKQDLKKDIKTLIFFAVKNK